jgi:hypothetical protein
MRFKERYFVYRYMHVIMAMGLSISAFSWLVGQPLVSPIAFLFLMVLE